MEDNGYFVKRLFYKYAVPIIITLIGSISGSVVNSVMAGNYFGSGGLAIIGLCSPITFLFCTLGALIGIGGAGSAAKFIGRDDYNSVNALYGTSLTLTLFIGIIVSLSGLIFMGGITQILTNDTELLVEVKRYYTAYVPFGLFFMLQYTVAHFARINGRPNVGMYMFAVMVILNIIFNFVFAGVLGFGIEAIALGAGIAAIGANISGFIFLKTKKGALKFGKPRIACIRGIVSAGSPSALSNLFSLLRLFIFNGLLITLGGEIPLAVFSVITSVTAIATAAMYGIGQTLIPLIGILNEEKDNESIRQIMKLAFIFGSFITIILSLCVGVLIEPIFAVYGINDPSVQAMLKTALFYLSVSFIFSLVNILFTYYYTAMSKFWVANLLTFTREFLFAVLLAYGLSQAYGTNGIWLSLLLSEIAAVIMIIVCSCTVRAKNQNLSMLFMFDKRLEKNSHYISFSVDNNPKAITEASEKITGFCEKNELSPKQSMLISMSIEEIIMLIVNNGMTGNTYNAVAVRVFILDDMVILRIRNSGKKFNPIEYYNKTISVDIEKSLEVIGLKYIIGASSAINYRETFGVNNLTIIL